MWAEQAPASYFTNDAGRPTPPASDVAFIPLRVQPALEGYPESDDTHASDVPPALFIKLVVAGQVRTHRLTHRAGLSLKHYLKEAGLIGARMRLALNIDGVRRVQMSYVPRAGETLNMVSPQRPLMQLRSA
jgi:hypothetical protein